MAKKKQTEMVQLDYLIEQLEENIFNATKNKFLLEELQKHCGRDKEKYCYYLRSSWLTVQHLLFN